MRIILNVLLLAIIIALGYLLIAGINEPIKFRQEKTKRERAVGQQLSKIRTAQELYRDITGQFANNFDSLSHVLKHDSIPIQQVFGDPDDPSGQEYVYRTIYTSARDSVNRLEINLDSLRYVPYSDPVKEFYIDADTLTYQKTLVSVCEVGVPWKDFMGKYADPKYAKYDDSYDPNLHLKFGNMSSPNLSGNWGE